MSKRPKEQDLDQINLYRLMRRDGVIRTGIEIGDSTEMGTVEGEEGELPDPVLAWWIEVRIKGKKLPIHPEEARRWLLDHAGVITSALRQTADEVRAGLDFATWMPFLKPVSKPPRGVRMTVACHASRRTDALTIAGEMTAMANHWPEWVEKMPVLQPA